VPERWRRRWPAAVFVLVQLGNTDAAIVNHDWLQWFFGISLLQLLLGLVVISLAELVYENWFFGWYEHRAMAQAPSWGFQIFEWLRSCAYDVGAQGEFDTLVVALLSIWSQVRKLWELLIADFDWRNHPTVKKRGYRALAYLSALPVIGGRTAAVLIHRGVRLPGGLMVIGVCSAFRTCYTLYLLVWLTRYMSLRSLGLVVTGLILAWIVGKIRKLRKHRKDRQ